MLILLTLAACSLGGAPSVSFDTVEEARGTARDNSLFNGQAFRQANVEYQNWSIESRGDSTQSNDCPQGDGWATLKFVSPDQTKVINVKCSTVSANIGCLPETEFKSKPYAADDGCRTPKMQIPAVR